MAVSADHFGITEFAFRWETADFFWIDTFAFLIGTPSSGVIVRSAPPPRIIQPVEIPARIIRAATPPRIVQDTQEN